MTPLTVEWAKQNSAMRESVELILEEKSQEGIELTEEQVDNLYEYIMQRVPRQFVGRLVVKGPLCAGFYDEFFANLNRGSC